MDKRVYLLTIVAFIVGMVELLIGGILDLIAEDLNVSLGKAGLLITIFSLVFAIAAPILIVLTSNVERKKLTLLSLLVFLIGNSIAVFSTTYNMLMVSRIVSAISGSLLIVLCITVASSIVAEKYIGRAIGIVIMGISGSLVLGVPIGLIIGHSFGWRAPFFLIGILTIILILSIYFFMSPIQPQPSLPIKKQLATLKSSKILSAHLTIFLFLTGHMTLYAYFTPFLKTTMGLNPSWISIVYLIFGVSAVMGGGIGGILSDKFGATPVLITVITGFAISMFSIPYVTFALPIFLIIIIVWGMMNWTITPALQSYLIQTAPESAAVHQSLNNSFLHFGIAFGSFIGSLVIEQGHVEQNATVGGFFVVLALGTILFSITRKNPTNQ